MFGLTKIESFIQKKIARQHKLTNKNPILKSEVCRKNEANYWIHLDWEHGRDIGSMLSSKDIAWRYVEQLSSQGLMGWWAPGIKSFSRLCSSQGHVLGVPKPGVLQHFCTSIKKQHYTVPFFFWCQMKKCTDFWALLKRYWCWQLFVKHVNYRPFYTKRVFVPCIFVHPSLTLRKMKSNCWTHVAFVYGG